MRMTIKERQFVTYYLGKAKGNGTLAATMAGYGNPPVAAHRLVRKDKIQRLIDAKLDKSAMDADEVLARLSMLATSDASDFLNFGVDDDPASLPSIDLRRARQLGKLGVIKKLKQTTRKVKDGDEWITERELEIELYAPIQPLGLLAKYHGLTGEQGDAIPTDAKPRIFRPDERDRSKQSDTG